ncbi:hypothetical protein ACLKA6_011218 [Drosophila palustris]
MVAEAEPSQFAFALSDFIWRASVVDADCACLLGVLLHSYPSVGISLVWTRDSSRPAIYLVVLGLCLNSVSDSWRSSTLLAPNAAPLTTTHKGIPRSSRRSSRSSNKYEYARVNHFW